MEFVDKWLTITGNRSETPRFLSKTGKSYVNRMSTKKSTCFHGKNVNKHVDNVDNFVEKYYPQPVDSGIQGGKQAENKQKRGEREHWG